MSEPLDAEAMDESTPRQTIPISSSRPPSQRRRRLHWLNGLVSLLVVAGIVGGVLVLLRSHVSPTPGPDTWVGGTPVTREAEVGGLDFVMHVTPGPYFLGELLVADLSLTNDSLTTYTLAGPSEAGACGAAVFVDMTGGGKPQYVLPVDDTIPCPFLTSKLAPGETMTLHEFLPVANTGTVTLESGADFLQTVAGPNGSQSTTSAHSPLDGHWPALTLSVAAATPSDRHITVQHLAGTQVRINASPAARAHLYYIYTVTCHAVQGGAVGTGNFAWEPLSTTTVHEPTCGDSGSQTIQWSYAVSAPGYAIASGHVDS